MKPVPKRSRNRAGTIRRPLSSRACSLEPEKRGRSACKLPSLHHPFAPLPTTIPPADGACKAPSRGGLGLPPKVRHRSVGPRAGTGATAAEASIPHRGRDDCGAGEGLAFDGLPVLGAVSGDAPCLDAVCASALRDRRCDRAVIALAQCALRRSRARAAPHGAQTANLWTHEARNDAQAPDSGAHRALGHD